MYRIVYEKKFIKSLKDIPVSQHKAIYKKINQIGMGPRTTGVKLSGFENMWRARQGDYRIIYSIMEDEIIVSVIDVGHRKQIYKQI